LDRLLDLGHADVGLVAGVVTPTRAEEVVVLDAVAAGALAEAQAPAAAEAVQRPGEVVPVGADLLAAPNAVIEDFLDGVEGGDVDERWVVALVLGTLEGDDAEIVAAAQHGGDAAEDEWPSGALAAGQ
jgi:hypothetical protein